MLVESNLKIGDKYLYWSPSKQCHIRVAYKGKRKEPGFDRDVFVFQSSTTYDEVWVANLINIVIDDGCLERFVDETG